MHVLIVGQGLSGKTFLAQRLAASYQARGVRVLVYDPIGDPAWPADYRTDHADSILWQAKHSRDCAIFLDEARTIFSKWEERFLWLATESRHWGHIVHFISQRAIHIPPTVRDQCDAAFIFKQSFKDAKTLLDDYDSDELLNARTLPPFHFYKVGTFSAAVKMRLSLPGLEREAATR